MIATRGKRGGKFDEFTARQVAIESREFYLAGRKPTEYSDEFYTPFEIVEPLGPFDLDPCAGPLSSFARRNIRPPQDGLRVRWSGRVCMNPPYSAIHAWLAKFVEHGNGICLVNARVETKWFQRLLAGSYACLFVAGRIQFERPDRPAGNPPVGSALLAYGRDNAAALRRSGLPGVLVIPKASGRASAPR